MKLPETERLEIAIALLDQCSPTALSEKEILGESRRLQDELESGVVRDVDYDQMISGVIYRPKGSGQ